MLQRDPTPGETQTLTQIYRKHREQYLADARAAQDLLHVGDRAPAAMPAPADLAAWTSVARVLLNLHETITRN